MMIAPGNSLYNQNALDDRDFVANFVARHTTLDALIRRLRAAQPSRSDTNHILIGPRGMGKTSLLRRVSIAITQDSELADRYVPLRFREEQYNVLKLADFWRNCGEALAEWAEATGRTELAARLDLALFTPAWSNELAGDQLKSELAALGRRAVLLVDNLDLILDALPAEECWTLRRYLQEPDGPIIIGAATHPLGQSADREAAFYEFFQPDYLYPLDSQETEACMRAIAAVRGENGKHVIEVLDRQPGRLKTLHTLTGGNPRVLALIYRLLETDETGAAMADLEVLLDQVTPYYKARVEEYQTPQQRAVIDAVALHWDPITTADLAQATDIVTTTLSGLLIRLRKDNLVEMVSTSGSYSGHQLVERFFNIWYLMRHGTRRTKQKMRWLVEFLTSFYSSIELNDIVKRAQAKGTSRDWRPDYALAVEEALARCGQEPADQKAEAFAASQGSGDSSGEIDTLFEQAHQAWLANDFAKTLDLLDRCLAASEAGPANESANFIPQILFNRALVLGRLGGREVERREYDALIERGVSSRWVAERLMSAKAMINKSVIVGEQEGDAAEDALLDQIIELIRGDEHPSMREQLYRAWSNKAANFRRLGRDRDAILAYDEIIHHAQGDRPNEQWLADAMIHRAMTLSQLGESESALTAYDAVIALCAQSSDGVLTAKAARAMLGKAATYMGMDERARAIAMFEQIVRQFGERQDSPLRHLVNTALYHLAKMAELDGEIDAALGHLDMSIKRSTGLDDRDDLVLLGHLLSSKAHLVATRGDHQEAYALYDQIIDRFGHSDDEDQLDNVGDALINKALVVANTGDWRAEIAIYDDVIARFSGSALGEVQGHLANAMINKAITLDDNGGDKAEILALYRAAIELVGVTTDVNMLELVSTAMLNTAIALGEVGRADDAIAEFDQVINRFADHTEASLRRDAASAMVNKAIHYHLIGDEKLEVATYRQALSKFGSDTEIRSSTALFQACLYLARSLEEAGDFGEAITYYEAALARIDAGVNSPRVDDVAMARWRLAALLIDTERDLDRAEDLYRTTTDGDPVSSGVNIAWIYLIRGQIDAAAAQKEYLEALPAAGKALLDAALNFARGNFGLAVDHLKPVLEDSLDRGEMTFVEDVYRVLRLAVKNGFGERLLDWFVDGGLADRLAPLYVGFKAMLHGAKLLDDVSPEVREPATIVFRHLSASRSGVVQTSEIPPSRRRPRKA